MSLGNPYTIIYFETLLQNFISISIISPNFRTIHPGVTENLSGQNMGGKNNRRRNGVKTMSPHFVWET